MAEAKEDSEGTRKIITCEGKEFDVSLRMLRMFKALDRLFDLGGEDGLGNRNNDKPLEFSQGMPVGSHAKSN